MNNLRDLIAKWSAYYGVDENATWAIVANEVGYKGACQASGAYPIGDRGTSFGPMQIHTGDGAIGAWEKLNGSIAREGSYTYLAEVGCSLAIQIGVWTLAQCIAAMGGENAAAFARYNGSGPLARAYGERAYAHFLELSYRG
jgi:hypothetical protein